jgi:hypothetical protein
VTYSGTRGQQVPVSIFKVRPNGTRETFSSGIVNATSMAIDAQGRLYVSSRFEGTVYRVATDGTFEVFATDLGVACGLAFSKDGTLFVGDRVGTIFRVHEAGRQRSRRAAERGGPFIAMSSTGDLNVTARRLPRSIITGRTDKSWRSPRRSTSAGLRWARQPPTWWMRWPVEQTASSTPTGRSSLSRGRTLINALGRSVNKSLRRMRRRIDSVGNRTA